MTSIHSKCLGFLGEVVVVMLAMLKFDYLTLKMEDNITLFQKVWWQFSTQHGTTSQNT